MQTSGSAFEVVARLQCRGIEFKADGDTLKVRARAILSDDERQYIREHKAQVIEALKAKQRPVPRCTTMTESEIDWLMDALRKRWPHY